MNRAASVVPRPEMRSYPGWAWKPGTMWVLPWLARSQ